MDYATIVSQVNEVLAKYTGRLTLRQVYYRLVARYELPNRRNSYGYLSKILVKARENGEVDDNRFVDKEREDALQGGDWGYGGAKDYLAAKVREFAANEYTRRAWQDQPKYVEVWVEKRALEDAVVEACEGLRVVVVPSKGYASYTSIKKMAVEGRFNRVGRYRTSDGEWLDKPIVVLDLRDHDPSGLHMTEDLRNRLSRYSDPELHIRVKRIALTIEQVRRYALPPNPVKSADPRSPSYYSLYGRECWEMDAVEPDEFKRLVRDAVTAEIDWKAWEETRKRSDRERKKLEAPLRRLAEKLGRLVDKEGASLD